MQLAAPDPLSTLPDVGSIALLVAPPFLLSAFQVCQHSVDHRREPGQLVVALGHNSCRKIAARSDGSDILPQPNQSREHQPFQQEQRNHTEYNPDHQRRNHQVSLGILSFRINSSWNTDTEYERGLTINPVNQLISGNGLFIQGLRRDRR